MRFHLIGGFLGSGKTTAIIGAARHLMSQGRRVGVVTNDQGKYLVDTAFFQAAHLPTVEVTGGCFCCNYDDLGARLSQLKDSAQPDVIFAESVGSCADVVATVVKPFLELGTATLSLNTYTVFTDIRLLRRRLLDQPMPFSDDVVYIFDKQIEEANLLILNKADLLSPQQAESTISLAQARFPGKHVRLQDSRRPEQIAEWIALLESGKIAPPRASVEIDYQRYGAGEAHLAWLDEAVHFDVRDGTARQVVLMFIETIAEMIAGQAIPVGHVKFLVRSSRQGQEIKISLPTLTEPDWQAHVPDIPGNQITLMVNARVETAAQSLRELIGNAVRHTAAQTGAVARESDLSTFHPAFPTPTHRIA